MSLAFGEKVAEEDDDSFHLLPPRLSLPLEDGRHTRTSVEMGRRAYSERPTGRRSGGSYDGMRMSDRFSDMNELQLDPISEDQEDGSTLHSKRDGFEDDIGDFEEYVDQRSVYFPMSKVKTTDRPQWRFARLTARNARRIRSPSGSR